MTRAVILLALLALRPLAATEVEWDVVAAGPSSAWSLKRGTVNAQTIRGAANVIAIVKREDNAGGPEQQFLVAVPLAHCGAPRGDIRLQPLDGGAPIEAVWIRDAKAVPDAMATALCNRNRSKLT